MTFPFWPTDRGRIGEALVSRVHETMIVETARDWLLGFDAEALKPHEAWLVPHHYDPATSQAAMPVHSWLLRARGRTILIDACCGNHKDRLGIPGMHGLDTPFLERLAAAGARPEQVDYVLCTHLHLDHTGWNTRLVDGRWVPTFPNAKYLASRAELDHAAAATGALDRLVYQDSVAPILEAGQLVAIGDEPYDLEGLLTIRPAPGHSPGHVRIELRSGGALGVFAGDIIHSPIQAPFWTWSTCYCADPAQAAVARRQLLEFCTDTGALLLPGHFNHTPVARVRAHADAFALDFGWPD